MRKSKSDRFFLGVEHKPKKKLNKKFMKPIQEQENDIVIWIESQWKKNRSMKSLCDKFSQFFLYYRKTGQNSSFFNFILNFIWFKKCKKKPLHYKLEVRKGPLEKTKDGWNLHIDFFSQFLLNRMHQKVPVRLLRDTILS